MWGLFTELGPFFVGYDEASVVKNPYSWHKTHSIIFIDNPVGTGRPTKLHNFSSTKCVFIYVTSHWLKNHDCVTRKPRYLSQSSDWLS